MRAFIGIDPGKNGAMAIICTDDHKSITKIDIVSPFDDKEYIHYLSMACYEPCLLEENTAICCLEKVSAMPKQGVVSMFNFGMNFGWIQGVLQAKKIPYELVTPQKWKKEFSVTADKNTSIDVAKRLFPTVSLKQTERCKKDHDGMAEALLMAEYARRKL